MFTQILRSSDGGSTYDTIFENETYLTDYQFDSGLLPATLYFYKVQSFYRSAASVESNADTACTCTRYARSHSWHLFVYSILWYLI